MRVDRTEVELAGDQEDHDSDGGEAAEAASAARGGLEQAIEGFEDPLVCRVRLQATMPSRCWRTIAATSFIGSTFERMTQVHQRVSIARTTLICLRSRISRSGSF